MQNTCLFFAVVRMTAAICLMAVGCGLIAAVGAGEVHAAFGVSLRNCQGIAAASGLWMIFGAFVVLFTAK